MTAKVLTIAGSDCSGGAGIQADLKTMMAHDVYGMSVITALTAQNTTGVYGILETPPEFVAQQIDCVFQDIRPDAVKIGMVPDCGIMEVIAEKLKQYQAENIVIDTVMISTSGHRLMSEQAMQTYTEKLLPLAAVITPNLPEAEALYQYETGAGIRAEKGSYQNETGAGIRAEKGSFQNETGAGFHAGSEEDMKRMAEKIAGRYGGALLIKGGHLCGDAADLLCENGNFHWFRTERIQNPNSHGTGCTLSSAIACNLAKGKTVYESVYAAKEYVTDALRAGLNLGRGSGPLAHNCKIGRGSCPLAHNCKDQEYGSL